MPGECELSARSEILLSRKLFRNLEEEFSLLPKTVLALMLALCVMGLLTSVAYVKPVKARTIIVPDDYPTIQAAIDNAAAGDTIFVRNGTYYENIVIAKPLSLVGENKSDTIIDGGGVLNVAAVVEVNSDNVTVTGFTIRGSDPYIGGGIVLSANNCNISDNVVSGNNFGIRAHTSGSIICGNTITNNTDNSGLGTSGLGLDVSGSGNVICENTMTNNTWGVLLQHAENTVFKNNNLTNNVASCRLNNLGGINEIGTSNLVDGRPLYFLTNQENKVIAPPVFSEVGYLALQSSTNVTMTGLTTEGISLTSCTNCTIRNSTISNSEMGICLISSSSNNTISHNTLNRNGGGIYLGWESDNNVLVGNDISTNGIGIALGNDVTENHILDNTIADNEYYGIGIWYVNTRNLIVHNNFINDTAFEYHSNVWDYGYPSGGNYWSGYTGQDVFSGPYQNVTGSDGIGDTPYTLPDNIVDHYPLMQPWSGNEISLNVVSSYGSPTPPDGSYGFGTNITESVNSPIPGPPGVQCVCIGWTGTGSVPTSGNASFVTFAITQDSSIIWNWKTQDYLTVTSPYDSSSNMSYWVDDGTTLTESVNSPVMPTGVRYSGTRYVCSGWSGTGSVPVSGNTSSVTFVIIMPSTITWNWNITNICDLDNSGTVSMKDVGMAAKAFGVAPGDSRWNAIADITGLVGTPDGRVDLRDIALIARNFGWTVTNP